jgi:hypothetical protein
MVLYSGGPQREQPYAPVRESAPHTAEQTFFLERLTRLSRKTVLLGRYLVPADRRLQLLNRALLSTYEDCRRLGVGDEAHEVLGKR